MMKTNVIASIILGVSTVVLGFCGIWLIKLGNKTSQRNWSFIGWAVCGAAFILFVMGAIGFFVAGLR